MGQEKNSSFEYNELLGIFLAVAITAMATRAAAIANKYNEFSWNDLLEIIFFCVFYTLLRIKWYLDDIKDNDIKLPSNEEIKKRRENMDVKTSEWVLVFALVSWFFWLLAAFCVPGNMIYAYIFLMAGILSGSLAAHAFVKLNEKGCDCCLHIMNGVYIILMLIAVFLDLSSEKTAAPLMALAIGFVFLDSKVKKSFVIGYCKPKPEDGGTNEDTIKCCLKSSK